MRNRKERIVCLFGVLVLLVIVFSLTAAAACAEESLEVNGCKIIHENGKDGIADADGRVLLPAAYDIPLDPFDPEEPEPANITVYQYMEEPYTGVYDLARDLDEGRMKVGFFHISNHYFSGCHWKHALAIGDYAAVRNDEERVALLDTATGEILLDYEYAGIEPYVTEGWVYVWLWPTEYDDRIGWIFEPAYVSLESGEVLHAPEYYWFSEEFEPIVDGSVLVYDETGASCIPVDELLRLQYMTVNGEKILVDLDSLRTLEYIKGDAGLTCLRIHMNNGSNRSYPVDNLPEHCFLDTYHDGNAILMDYYMDLPTGPIQWEEVPMENHLWLTFEFDDESAAWKLTNATDACTWTAHIQDGVYTFDDYYEPDETWQWVAPFEVDLCKMDFQGLADLVKQYNEQTPDRPSLSY